MKYHEMSEAINKLISHKELKLDGVYVSSKMQSAIELWDYMYKGYGAWMKKGEIYSAGIPASVSSEIARLVTLELESTVAGSERADYINKIYNDKVLGQLRQQVEYACAKGSMVFKPYVSDGSIAIQFNQADSFFPIAFNGNGEIEQCAFTEQFSRGREIYTRIELHTLVGDGVKVNNYAYKSSSAGTIGTEINLDMVRRWKDIEPQALLSGAKKLLIGYFKMPLANNIDSKSPLGASIFSRAVDSIMIADKRYSQIDWEYDSKETAIHIATSLLEHDQQNDKLKYPGGKKRLYRKIEYNAGAADKPFIDTFSPDIRDTAYYHGYNEQLRKIEFECGLAYGTLSDVNEVEKTAEEIKASKQRSYANVSEIQHALQKALVDLVDAIDYWIDVTPELRAPDGKYSVTFNWDDSIVTDNEMQRQQDRQDVAMGVMSLAEYRSKWYGETLEEAEKKLPEQADTLDKE